MARPDAANRVAVEREAFGRVLRALRSHVGWSQADLAHSAEVSAAMVAKLEQGKRGPSRSVLDQLARSFGLPGDDLVELANRVEGIDPDSAAFDDAVGALIDRLGVVGRGAGLALEESTPYIRDSAVVGDRRARQVMTAPAGEAHYVLADAVARDGDHWWVDPTARVSAVGEPDRDPRVERLDDGRILLDVSWLPGDAEWPSRDPDRHLVRARLVGDTPPDPETLVEVYASTVIEIDWDGVPIVLTRRPAGITEGEFPVDASVVHVLTAQNPRSRLLLSHENADHNRTLQRQLELRGWRFHGAAGRSPDGTWAEQGFAIVDADRDAVLALAREHAQNAIFEWTAQERAVIWCDHDRRDTHGWSAT